MWFWFLLTLIIVNNIFTFNSEFQFVVLFVDHIPKERSTWKSIQTFSSRFHYKRRLIVKVLQNGVVSVLTAHRWFTVHFAAIVSPHNHCEGLSNSYLSNSVSNLTGYNPLSRQKSITTCTHLTHKPREHTNVVYEKPNTGFKTQIHISQNPNMCFKKPNECFETQNTWQVRVRDFLFVTSFFYVFLWTSSVTDYSNTLIHFENWWWIPIYVNKKIGITHLHLI